MKLTLKSLRTGQFYSLVKKKNMKCLLLPSNFQITQQIDHMRPEFGISQPLPRPAWMTVQMETFK